MLIQEAYGALKPCTPFLAFCPKCKDRVRFDVGSPNLVVCNCTVAKWRFPNNCLRFTTIRGRVTDHVCDARCMNATGGVCECSCGGANHGGKFSAHLHGEG